MRKIHLNCGYIIYSILILIFYAALTTNAQQKTLAGEPVYFSYKSACNVSLKFLKNKTVLLIINGKAKTCTIRQNATSSKYFDLISAGKVLAIFLYDDNDIVILNQQYQFECEQAKGIDLSLVNNDQEVLAAFKEYIKDRNYVWNDIAALNDKAYYLEGFKCYGTSVYILEEILLKDPERVVAWLNLGDSYWALHKQEAAKKAYLQYVLLMKRQGKDLNKIPQRVNDRVK